LARFLRQKGAKSLKGSQERVLSIPKNLARFLRKKGAKSLKGSEKRVQRDEEETTLN